MPNNIHTINQITTYIEDHLGDKLDLDTISQSTYYSKYHLHRLFAKTAGITIHGYLQRRRLTESAKLLSYSSMPIVNIALLAGYANQQAFSSVFREFYKQTPLLFREREKFYPLQSAYNFAGIFPNQKHLKIGKEISLAQEKDIPAWLDLAQLCVDGFPKFQMPEHEASLKRYIAKKGAYILKADGFAIGIMLLSYKINRIDFMAFHPLYRKPEIYRQFLNHTLPAFKNHNKIRITTFRKGDKADTGYRNALQGLGFSEGKLLTEFGYPTQEMVLNTVNLKW